jgi:hypothetical protein
VIDLLDFINETILPHPGSWRYFDGKFFFQHESQHNILCDFHHTRGDIFPDLDETDDGRSSNASKRGH